MCNRNLYKNKKMDNSKTTIRQKILEIDRDLLERVNIILFLEEIKISIYENTSHHLSNIFICI